MAANALEGFSTTIVADDAVPDSSSTASYTQYIVFEYENSCDHTSCDQLYDNT